MARSAFGDELAGPSVHTILARGARGASAVRGPAGGAGFEVVMVLAARMPRATSNRRGTPALACLGAPCWHAAAWKQHHCDGARHRSGELRHPLRLTLEAIVVVRMAAACPRPRARGQI